MRDKLGLPSTFTLDACRHGGMTELEEAELTDGQGRALSAHKSQQAYEGYAKRTMERALSATRKRHAHRLVNVARTNIQNEPQNDIQNAETAQSNNGAK
jgi:type IV secretory pathway component VirB8